MAWNFGEIFWRVRSTVWIVSVAGVWRSSGTADLPFVVGWNAFTLSGAGTLAGIKIHIALRTAGVHIVIKILICTNRNMEKFGTDKDHVGRTNIFLFCERFTIQDLAGVFRPIEVIDVESSQRLLAAGPDDLR